MAIFRKESGNLVRKAGKAIIDLALNINSNHAIANSAVTSKLTANNQILQFAYQDNKYGFIIDGTFYPLDGGSGGSMKCVKFGTTTSGNSVDISNLGFTSAEDYMVIVDSGAARLGGQDSGYGSAAYISAKTATSFTISSNYVYVGTPAPPVSYQVISFVG